MTNDTSTADSSFRDDHNPLPDAQGQAALLLIESLIHSLDNKALTKAQALEAIESAKQVKAESAAEEKEPARILQKSLGLLEEMQNSIQAHSGRYDEEAQAGPQNGQQQG
jgi:non-homologous end joining protein Ku